MKASRLLWQICGSPKVAGCDAALTALPCCLCGETAARGKPAADELGASYTDWPDLVSRSGWVCEPCCHGRSTFPDIPGRGVTRHGMRIFSHLLCDGQWQAYTKADPHTAQRIFRPVAGPWALVIATSGQRHLLNLAPVNESWPLGGIQFERRTVSVDCRALATLTAQIGTDRAVGILVREIVEGQWSANRIRVMGPEVYRRIENTYRRRRGSDVLTLAAAMATRPPKAAKEGNDEG